MTGLGPTPFNYYIEAARGALIGTMLPLLSVASSVTLWGPFLPDAFGCTFSSPSTIALTLGNVSQEDQN